MMLWECQLMDGALLDNLVLLFALVYYAVLFIVYMLRAHELTELEWKMGPVFSALLVPFYYSGC